MAIFRGTSSNDPLKPAIGILYGNFQDRHDEVADPHFDTEGDFESWDFALKINTYEPLLLEDPLERVTSAYLPIDSDDVAALRDISGPCFWEL